MTAQELRDKYLKFFESKGHTIIPSASLVPHEIDSSVLFTTAGMHPLVPYLLGAEHPTGAKRVANVQKCVRTGDIDDVGDNRHLTFFEMMGNWSFGDYFKKEAIEWSFEFLISPQWLGLDPKKIYVTVFKGENGIPRDEDAIKIWQEVFAKNNLTNGVAGDDEVIKNDVRIIPLGTDDNFWIAGATGPCGGDTEMFYDTFSPPLQGGVRGGNLEGKFSDLVNSFRLIEIWNDVFMEYEKRKVKGEMEKEEYEYVKLAKPNVDTGMGVERTLAVLNGKETVFDTELFDPIFDKLKELSGMEYGDKSDEEYINDGKQCWVDVRKQLRIIADHVKASTFMIADGVVPSNVGRGYVLRRLIRRAVRYGKLIGIEKDFTSQIAEVVIEMYGDFYAELETNKDKILSELTKEEDKFKKTLENGLKEFDKLALSVKNTTGIISGKEAFDLYQTFGFPFEITKELAREKNLSVNEEEFYLEGGKHTQLSRTASAGMFKGGLQGTGEMETKYHTATHLLHAALRKILGEEVLQKGSNITAERLRFDFSYSQKMTSEQIKQVEDLVNEQIQKNLPVTYEEMTVEEAKSAGAIGVFDAKYGDKVKVYTVGPELVHGEFVESIEGGPFSREICGGPHVENTGVLGIFKIVKEEAVSAGVRRIKAILE